MLAEADIVQDTRKLWEWALEPLFSVSGNVLSAAAPTRRKQEDSAERSPTRSA